MRLHVHEWGDPSAPTVVCLHGITGHGLRFRKLAEDRLAHRFHVLAPDLRGHGRSDWDPPWTVATHLDDVLETIGEEPAAWIGHSFGGRLVLELAARRPELVDRAVLLDPALRVLPHVARDMAELERPDASYETPEAAAQARYDAGRVLLAPFELVVDDEREHLAADRDGRLRHRYCKSAVIAAWSDLATAPPALSSGAPPVLTVIARDSWLLSEELIDELGLAASFAVEYVPGGHSVLWDAFGETADAVERFLG